MFGAHEYRTSRGAWSITVAPAADLRAGTVLGVDLNADHLAVCVLDRSGNPVGQPATTDGVDTAGLRASRRDGRVRAAITALLDTAEHTSCTAVVIENLNFADARATGRENMGRGGRGKAFRRTVAGIHIALIDVFLPFAVFSTCSGHGFRRVDDERRGESPRTARLGRAAERAWMRYSAGVAKTNSAMSCARAVVWLRWGSVRSCEACVRNVVCHATALATF